MPRRRFSDGQAWASGDGAGTPCQATPIPRQAPSHLAAPSWALFDRVAGGDVFGKGLAE